MMTLRSFTKAAAALAIIAAVSGCCKCCDKKKNANISTFAVHVYEVMKAKGITMQQAVDQFKAVGVTGFDGEYTDPKLEELAAAGLKPAMIYGVMSFRDPAKDEIEQNKYLDRAKKLGAKYMMIVPDMMGDLKDDPSDPIYEREFLKTVDGLKRLVAKCKAAGICPMVEDFGYRINPGSHFCNLKRYFAMIPDLKFALDTGNVMYSDRGTDILELFEYFHDKIEHVHVKDHPKGGPQDYALPGEGVVPNEKMLRQLFAEGYDGWVTLELFGASDMLDAVEKTCKFINSCR
jgi:inosose dehydratase